MAFTTIKTTGKIWCIMYTIAQVKKAFQKPRNAIMELNSVYHQRLSNEFNMGGTDFIKEDWDTLIILDSCRYDIFRERHDFNGDLQSRISRGAGTYEFLKGNVSEKFLLDTVYVTANPQFHYHRDELRAKFHEVWNIWQNRWNRQLNTVLPEETTGAAKEANELYPNKRLIIHYNQPHAPYIGPTGRELDGLTGKAREDVGNNNASFLGGLIRDILHPFSAEEHRQAYIENLDTVLSSVKRLLENLEGRIVVTSDHGQLLGERVYPIPVRYHGHRRGVHVDKLVKVPWLVIDSGERKEIISEKPNESQDNIDNDTVTDRLHDLGYLEY